MEVNLIPLEEHDPIYCSDDIEIYEVRKKKDNLLTNLKSIHLDEWKPSASSIKLKILSKEFELKQNEKFNGGSITPCSLLLSRYILDNKFKSLIEEKKKLLEPNEELLAIDLSKYYY